VILFNIIQPAGWRVGLLRIEDIALGCGVSLLVGLLLWPRGAAAALNKALAEAYDASAQYLSTAVQFGMERCNAARPKQPPPTREAAAAAASSRRLDDTFRGYLAERGAKRVPLAEATSLVTGVAGLRLVSDAVLDLWARDDGSSQGDRAAARREMTRSSDAVHGWYQRLAQGLLGRQAVPDALAVDAAAEDRLLSTVRHDLPGPDGHASATAVRMIWTADHLDAARRLQVGLVQPAIAASKRGERQPVAKLIGSWWRVLA
jgi:hypothetical protein